MSVRDINFQQVLDISRDIIAGSGNVYYKGTPTSVNTIIAGSGRLIRQ